MDFKWGKEGRGKRVGSMDCQFQGLVEEEYQRMNWENGIWRRESGLFEKIQTNMYSR